MVVKVKANLEFNCTLEWDLIGTKQFAITVAYTVNKQESSSDTNRETRVRRE